MSLDVYISAVVKTEVFERNITHNLGGMAADAGLHKPLWRPEELGITKCSELTPLLEKGLALLKSDPKRFQKFNPSNGWGDYDGLVKFVEKYLEACREYPDGEIGISK